MNNYSKLNKNIFRSPHLHTFLFILLHYISVNKIYSANHLLRYILYFLTVCFDCGLSKEEETNYNIASEKKFESLYKTNNIFLNAELVISRKETSFNLYDLLYTFYNNENYKLYTTIITKILIHSPKYKEMLQLEVPQRNVKKNNPQMSNRLKKMKLNAENIFKNISDKNPELVETEINHNIEKIQCNICQEDIEISNLANPGVFLCCVVLVGGLSKSKYLSNRLVQ